MLSIQRVTNKWKWLRCCFSRALQMSELRFSRAPGFRPPAQLQSQHRILIHPLRAPGFCLPCGCEMTDSHRAGPVSSRSASVPVSQISGWWRTAMHCGSLSF